MKTNNFLSKPKSLTLATLGICGLLFSVNTYSFSSDVRDCSDWGISNDAPQCIYIVNDTPDTIKLLRWGKISGDAGHGDDYYIQPDLRTAQQNGQSISLSPGKYYAVGGIDDQGHGAFEYTDSKFSTTIEINGQELEFAFEKAEIAAGVVHNFEFKIFSDSSWKDNERYEDKTINGTKYRVYVTDSGAELESSGLTSSFRWERVFTIRELDSNGNEFGNMGYVPASTENNSERLNIMNLNTYLLLGPSATAVWAKPYYYERAKSIWKERDRIFENIDILVLNELASQDIGSPDAEQLARESYLCCGADKPFRDRTTLLNGNPSVNGLAGPSGTGGVVIMSKYENSLEGNGHHYEYKKSKGECDGDCDMDKGYLGIKFTKPGSSGSKNYYIIGTHAQSDPGSDKAAARSKQFQAMNNHGESSTTSGMPVIYVGDFNVEPNEYDSMQSDLNATYLPEEKTGPISNSYDWESNFWVGEGNKSKYDFILYSNARELPSATSWRYIPIRSGKEHMHNGAGTDLSDHHAVVAEIDFTGARADYHQISANSNNATCMITADAIPEDGDFIEFAACELTESDFPPSPFQGLPGFNNLHNLYVAAINAAIARHAEQTTWMYDASTGYIRSKANPMMCLGSANKSNGTTAKIRNCAGGDQSDIKWTYEGGTGYIRSQVRTGRCLHRKNANWNDGNPIVLRGCGNGSAADKSWNLDTSL